MTVIAVVVVLVVVIAAVFVIISGNNGNPSRSDATDVRLTVFGNANGDDYLDGSLRPPC